MAGVHAGRLTSPQVSYAAGTQQLSRVDPLTDARGQWLVAGLTFSPGVTGPHVTRGTLEAGMTGLFLDEAQVLLFLVQPHEKGMTEHGRMQLGKSRILADPPHFAVQAHVAKRCAPFAQEQGPMRLRPCPVEPHVPLEDRNQLRRDRHDPAGATGIAPYVQLRFTMMCGSIGDTQGTKLLRSQSRMEEGQHNQLVDNRSAGSVSSGLVCLLLDVCQEFSHLRIRQA